jgi:hypothetical protein
MPSDAQRQGADETTDQDVFEGMDFEPVTAKAPEEGGQADSAPNKPSPEKKEPTKETKPQGDDDGAAPRPTNAEAKDRRVMEKKTKVTQEEWQTTQERLANAERELALSKVEKEQAKFEARNPIVVSERYAKKWEELCKTKLDPDHKYHRLDFEDLKRFLFDDQEVQDNREALDEYEEHERTKPIAQPALGSAPVRTQTPGGVDAETYSWLKSQGYSDAEIENSGDITLAGRR